MARTWNRIFRGQCPQGIAVRQAVGPSGKKYSLAFQQSPSHLVPSPKRSVDIRIYVYS